MNYSDEEFKNLFARCAVTLSVLTFKSTLGKPVGVLLSSLTSLSVNPPMISFNLSQKGYAWKEFQCVISFAVQILNFNQSHIAQQFSRPKDVDWTTIPHFFSSEDVPILQENLGIIEAKVKDRVIFANREIVIGTVKKSVINSSYEPLIYQDRQYKGNQLISLGIVETYKNMDNFKISEY